MKYLIANWKANKNLKDTNTWIDIIINQIKSNYSLKNKLLKSDIIIIICPPYPLIYPIKSKLNGLKNIFMGSQDISIHETGAYTGEVTAKTLQGLVDYTIIGHSERRKFFNENGETIEKKIINAKNYNIEPLLCVRDEKDNISLHISFIVYEPVYAISTGDGKGNYEPIDKILEMKNRLKLRNEVNFIYGGSVNENNISDYIKSDEIQGFFVGGASLDPFRFYKIISLA